MILLLHFELKEVEFNERIGSFLYTYRVALLTDSLKTSLEAVLSFNENEQSSISVEPIFEFDTLQFSQNQGASKIFKIYNSHVGGQNEKYSLVKNMQFY